MIYKNKNYSFNIINRIERDQNSIPFDLATLFIGFKFENQN